MVNINIFGILGMPEIKEKEDVATHIIKALKSNEQTLHNKDIVIITSKIVSKAEGRYIFKKDVVPSPFAIKLAESTKRDASHVEIILRESVRPVKITDKVLIMENKNGHISANSGVDQSNIEINKDEQFLLLPKNPDRSAATIRNKLTSEYKIDIAVIITDTFGRPWRTGQTNVAIGVSGMSPLKDYVNDFDSYGNKLKGTRIAIADQIAGASELVMGKVDNIPVAVMRGYSYPTEKGSSVDLLRSRNKDLFR